MTSEIDPRWRVAQQKMRGEWDRANPSEYQEVAGHAEAFSEINKQNERWAKEHAELDKYAAKNRDQQIRQIEQALIQEQYEQGPQYNLDPPGYGAEARKQEAQNRYDSRIQGWHQAYDASHAQERADTIARGKGELAQQVQQNPSKLQQGTPEATRQSPAPQHGHQAERGLEARQSNADDGNGEHEKPFKSAVHAKIDEGFNRLAEHQKRKSAAFKDFYQNRERLIDEAREAGAGDPEKAVQEQFKEMGKAYRDEYTALRRETHQDVDYEFKEQDWSYDRPHPSWHEEPQQNLGGGNDHDFDDHEY